MIKPPNSPELEAEIKKIIAFLFGCKVKDIHPDSATQQSIEEIMELITKHTQEAKEDVAKNALIIAEYWLEEDGRPKHLIQDLWDAKDISVLDHIDEKYILMYKALSQEGK